MMSRVELKEKIFEALVDLNEENKNNPRNVEVCVVDREANFYFYYEANSLFFWHEKNPIDFIRLTDNESPFWDDEDAPETWEDIPDIIQEYEMFIFEHITFDFPQRPYETQKILGHKNRLRKPLKSHIPSAVEFALNSKAPNIYNTRKKLNEDLENYGMAHEIEFKDREGKK